MDETSNIQVQALRSSVDPPQGDEAEEMRESHLSQPLLGSTEKEKTLVCIECGKSFQKHRTGVVPRYCGWRCRYQKHKKFPNPQAYRNYLRWRSYETAVVRFWRLVEKTDYCWNWKGGVSKEYGVFSVAHESIRAHKFSWLLHYGYEAILQVLHRCDNPICVRPDHLFEGTQRDNVLDCVQKGRHRWQQKQTKN